MKIEVLQKIWQYLDEGYDAQTIASYYYINPDIIDSINELRKSKVDLKVYS